MISSRRLIESSGNFWRDLTPLLPNYVKHVNMGGYERHDAPIRSETEKARHFLVNELAFTCFSNDLKPRSEDADIAYEKLQRKWIRRLPSNPWIDLPLTEDEIGDLSSLFSRLSSYSRILNLNGAIFESVTPAVGRLEYVEIDILTSDAICEVKSGERSFRSIDFRQLLVALIALGSVRIDNTLLLINPREGIVWKENAKDFVESISLRSISDFFGDSLYQLSEVGLSA